MLLRNPKTKQLLLASTLFPASSFSLLDLCLDPIDLIVVLDESAKLLGHAQVVGPHSTAPADGRCPSRHLSLG